MSTGELVTDWLPWIELRAGTTITWSPPTIGEQCLVFSPGGDLAAGVVLPAAYSDNHPAPSESADEFVAVFPDGARIVYDHARSHLDVSGISTGRIEAAQSFVVKCPEITLDGRVTVTDLLSYQAGMSGKNGRGNGTSITGDLTHNNGSLSSNGVVLHSHTHSGVQTGGGNTGEPT